MNCTKEFVDSGGKGTELLYTHIIQSLLRTSPMCPGNVTPITQRQPLEGGELRAAEGRGHQPGDLDRCEQHLRQGVSRAPPSVSCPGQVRYLRHSGAQSRAPKST